MMTRLSVCVALVVTALMGSSSAQTRSVPPEVVSLVTRDGVQLKATYFPGAARKGSAEAKQVAPVVLLHDHKETRSAFNSLAQRLQSPSEGDEVGPSFAAITVDLRGHGDSTRQVFPNGETIDLDASKLRRNDFFAMVVMDMAAVRSFLVDKNDAGELNLNKLCLVGAGMGANVAANWAEQDWRWPPLAVGKQGQDVKGLVLISPRWSYNGLSFQAPMRFRPLKEYVAWMLVYGAEDSKAAADVRRIEKQLERFHPDAKAAAAARGTSSLQVVALKSKLQGSTLVRQSGAPVEDTIVRFLSEHVATRQLPWSSRRQQLP